MKKNELEIIIERNEELVDIINKATNILYEYLNNLYSPEDLEYQKQNKKYDDYICWAYFVLKGEDK